MAAILFLLVLFAAGHFEVVEGLDLAFIVDASESICGPKTCPSWEFSLDLVKDTIQDMAIGPGDTRVAVVTFADYAVTVFLLNAYTENGALLKAIDNIEYSGGERNTTGAFQTALSDIFVEQNGDRPDVPDMIITLIGGPPTRAAGGLKAAVAEVRKRGIPFFTVGFGNLVKDNDLRMISSPPGVLNKDYFKVASIEALNAVGKELSARIRKL